MPGYGWLERLFREGVPYPKPKPAWATESTEEQPTVDPWASTAETAGGEEPEPAPDTATALDNRTPPSRFRACRTDWPPPNRR